MTNPAQSRMRTPVVRRPWVMPELRHLTASHAENGLLNVTPDGGTTFGS